MVDIGYSRFGDLNGVMQTMADAQGRQVLELIRRFSLVTWSDGKHHVLEPNEGIRSRARQAALYNAWVIYKTQGHPYAALAASPYTSRHDASHADAVDFGRDGGQALNGEYLDWVRANGPILGIFPDGLSFPTVETWHFGSYPSRAKQIPPTTITWRDAIYTPPPPVFPKEEQMFIQAVNPLIDGRIGNIQGRQFVLDTIVHKAADGGQYDGTIRWVSTPLESRVLTNAQGIPKQVDSGDIWNLTRGVDDAGKKLPTYERIGW